MNILCLEQGDWMDPSLYPTTGMDWEMRALSDFGLSPNARRRPEDYPVNDAESPISVSMFNAVGGSTILYAGHFPRFHPSDFRARTLDGVGDDWPIDYATLEPWYALNDRMTGVAGLAGDPAYPPKEVPLPPVPLGKLGMRVARGFDALGWHWWPSDSAIATREYDGRAPCVNLGPCIMGCAQGAKGSTDVTYWPPRCAGVPPHAAGPRDPVRDGSRRGLLRRGACAGSGPLVVLACSIGTPPAPELALRLFPTGSRTTSGLVGGPHVTLRWWSASSASASRATRGPPAAGSGASSSTRRTPRATSCAATRSS
jgi:choline dehydrogenase-like flavoprotein